MAKATDPKGAGKGDDYRTVDNIMWNRGWLRSKKYGIKCPKCNKSGDELKIDNNCLLCKGVGYLDKKYQKICTNPHCSHNGDVLSIDRFYKRKSGNKYIYGSWCKDCENRYRTKKYWKDPH
jgi:hypothetical protein